MAEEGLIIYVLPTEEGKPPRAVIGRAAEGEVEGPVAIWSRDTGTWTLGGVPLPQEVADAISEHARSLGVEDFL